MNWIYWTATVLAVIISFQVGKRVGANDAVPEIVKLRDQYWHKHFIQPWVKKYNRVLQKYNRVLQDMAEASIEEYCDSNKRNAILIAENERLRRKSIRLAFKYVYFRKKYENRPVEDAFSRMSSSIIEMKFVPDRSEGAMRKIGRFIRVRSTPAKKGSYI